MSKKDIAIALTGLTLAALAVAGGLGWHAERQHARALESQLADLERQRQRSAVLRSVSKQLEEIAYQQKEISEEEREKAIEQRHVADVMRKRSEVERLNALNAREQALASEHQAQLARAQAEQQQVMAEHQRIQAELSKRVADTLSFIALGRSLGSLSTMQTQLGNHELACLLADAAYRFTTRYGGDVYYPAVFQALTQASQSKQTWPRHKGALTGLAYTNADDRVVSTGNYGAIMIHQRKGDQLVSRTLVDNREYDFRDVFVDGSTIYAISRSGHLAIIGPDYVPHILSIANLDHPSYITTFDDATLLLVGDHGIALFDKARRMVASTRELNFLITTASRLDGKPVLFDDQGRQHLVADFNELTTQPIPVKGRVSAFASSSGEKASAYGMRDGTIYLYDHTTRKVKKLEGHLSRISKLKFNGKRLYSSSYDGNLFLWNIHSEKIEPMNMLEAGDWIMNFTLSGSKQFGWVGDQYGNLTEALLSVTKMADIVSQRLKRNFTTEEWNYYIGRNVPYEPSMAKDRKAVGNTDMGATDGRKEVAP